MYPVYPIPETCFVLFTYLDGATDEAPLNLIPNDDMHGVGHLITLHTDEGGILDLVLGGVHLLNRHTCESLWE